MNFNRLFSFLTILSLIFLSITVINGKEDVEISEDDSIANGNRSTEGKVGEEEENADRLPSLKTFQTNSLFIQPNQVSEIIAGKLVRLLIGARNNGDEEIFVQSIDGSIRYPQDYSYYIQNFTLLKAERSVEAGVESTFEYLFIPSEYFAGRPMGFVLLLNYQTKNGKEYQNVVFNETIQFRDIEEGFDGETLFLYLFLLSIFILIGFILSQSVLSSHFRRNQGKSSSIEEKGQPKGNYDLDWIPKHHLTQNRSSVRSTRVKKSRSMTNEQSHPSVGPSSENDE